MQLPQQIVPTVGNCVCLHTGAGQQARDQRGGSFGKVGRQIQHNNHRLVNAGRRQTAAERLLANADDELIDATVCHWRGATALVLACLEVGESTGD